MEKPPEFLQISTSKKGWKKLLKNELDLFRNLERKGPIQGFEIKNSGAVGKNCELRPLGASEPLLWELDAEDFNSSQDPIGFLEKRHEDVVGTKIFDPTLVCIILVERGVGFLLKFSQKLILVLLPEAQEEDDGLPVLFGGGWL